MLLQQSMFMLLFTENGDYLRLKEKLLKTKKNIKLIGNCMAAKKVAVIHCKGHQKLDSPITKAVMQRRVQIIVW